MVIKSFTHSPMAASCTSHASSRRKLTNSESDVANCLRLRRRRRRTERGAPSSGWLRQTDAEIENLKGASSSRTEQRRLSAAAELDRHRQMEMLTGRVHSAMPKAFW